MLSFRKMFRKSPTVFDAVRKIDRSICYFLNDYIAAEIVQLDNQIIESRRTKLKEGTHYLKIDRLRYWVVVKGKEIVLTSEIRQVGQ